MERKIYEIKGMDKCSMSTTYLGVKVHLEFKGGDMMSRKDGFISTDNPFVQSAIEAMPSFGSKIVLKARYPMQDVVAAPVTETAEEVVEKPRKAVTKKKSANTDDTLVVYTVKNINDAISYFGEKGLTFESTDQLKELIAKHNLSFPNLTME